MKGQACEYNEQFMLCQPECRVGPCGVCICLEPRMVDVGTERGLV